jgi:hypothetical protein
MHSLQHVLQSHHADQLAHSVLAQRSQHQMLLIAPKLLRP